MFDPLRAARAAGNAYTSALNAGLRYMPDFGATVRDGLKNDFEERMQVYDLNFQLDKTKKDSAAALDEYNRNRETESYVKDQQSQAKRFAGVVGGLGTVASAYALKKEYDRTNALELKRIEQRTERDRKITEFLTNSSAPNSNLVDGIMKTLLERRGLYKPGMTIDDINNPEFIESYMEKTRPQSNDQSSVPNNQPVVPSSYAIGITTNKRGYHPLSSTLGGRGLAAIIRHAEGTTGDKGYRTMYGGGTFDSFDRHPDTLVTKGGYTSSASGAYQFLTPTWNEAKKITGVSDFSPTSQEIGAHYLVARTGIDPKKIVTDYREFPALVDKIAPTWAGLPYQPVSPKGFGKGLSYYGQGGVPIEKLWPIYQRATGQIQ